MHLSLNRRVPVPHFNCYEVLLGSLFRNLGLLYLLRGRPRGTRWAPNGMCLGREKLDGFIAEGLDPPKRSDAGTVCGLWVRGWRPGPEESMQP